MDNEIRTKRAELRKFLLVECHMEGMAFIGVLDRADAYALAAHVAECGKMRRNKRWPGATWEKEDVTPSTPPPEFQRCGYGWYCEDASEMKQLGVEAT